MQVARAAAAPRRAQPRRGGRARRRPGRAGGRSAAPRARRGRARRDRPAAGRTSRRGSRLLELEHLAFDLDLVAQLRADFAQSPLELLLRTGRAMDAEATIGAQDAEAPALVGLRPVDEEARQPALVELRRFGWRA